MPFTIRAPKNRTGNSKASIALIGFMGAGKTTVGNELARRLNLELLETDLLIVQKAGKSIEQIFKDDGEIAFREIEIEVIKEISQEDNLVIDCGGGVVLNKINIDRLRQRAAIVYLYARVEELAERVRNDKSTRPLLSRERIDEEVKSIFKCRASYYRRSADFTVDTMDKTVSQVVEHIVDRLVIT